MTAAVDLTRAAMFLPNEPVKNDTMEGIPGSASMDLTPTRAQPDTRTEQTQDRPSHMGASL